LVVDRGAGDTMRIYELPAVREQQLSIAGIIPWVNIRRELKRMRCLLGQSEIPEVGIAFRNT
jgi:hypothetical protein